MVGYLVALLWGFAEATLFFIVPDVGLSIIAVQDKRKGIIACLYALAGAMIGGAVMFYWGQSDLETVICILDTIPAIRPIDISQVSSDLLNTGITALLMGPLLGIPYKIYAAHAHLVTSIGNLLLITIPARIIRFLFVTLVTRSVTDKYLTNISIARRIQLVLLFWGILYTFYFIIKRG